VIKKEERKGEKEHTKGGERGKGGMESDPASRSADVIRLSSPEPASESRLRKRKKKRKGRKKGGRRSGKKGSKKVE